jgi:hypothetical protein
MAKAGNNYSTMLSTAASPDEVTQSVLSGLNGAAGYSMNMAGANTVMLTRRFNPSWVIWVCVIFFPIGLFALLCKETESLTVNVAKADHGAKVIVSGTATPELASRLHSIVTALETHPTPTNLLPR